MTSPGNTRGMDSGGRRVQGHCRAERLCGSRAGIYLAALLKYSELVSILTHQLVPLPYELLNVLRMSPESKNWKPHHCERDICKNWTGMFGEHNDGLQVIRKGGSVMTACWGEKEEAEPPSCPSPEPLRMLLKGGCSTTGWKKTKAKDFSRKTKGPQTEHNPEQIKPASQFSLGPAQAIEPGL